jgi:hypothetical protein
VTARPGPKPDRLLPRGELSVGDEEARALGLHPGRTRLLVVAACALALADTLACRCRWRGHGPVVIASVIVEV